MQLETTITLGFLKAMLEIFRFSDEGDYEYEISSQYQIIQKWCSRVNQRHGKRDSRRHSTTSFIENVVAAEASY